MKTSQAILFVLVVAIVIGLWSWLPAWLFVLVMVAAAYAVVKAQGRGVEPALPSYDQDPLPIAPEFPDELAKCRHFMALANWDAARDVLQRIAYGILQQPQEVQDSFKALMTEFAAADPLVSGVTQAVLPVVRAQPGILQTELYKHAPGVGVEQMRYALYFLEQLRVIERKKSGRSYKVYEARPVIEA